MHSVVHPGARKSRPRVLVTMGQATLGHAMATGVPHQASHPISFPLARPAASVVIVVFSVLMDAKDAR